VFDAILSLNHEIEYMWKSRWTFTNIMLMWTRYQTFIVAILQTWLNFETNITGSACYKPVSITVWLVFFGFCPSGVIGMLRTWAIYGNARRMVLVLVAQGAGYFIIGAYATSQFIHSIEMWEFEGINGCVGTSREKSWLV